MDTAGLGNGCCDGDDAPDRACVFAKALLAQSAACACAQRDAVGERTLVRCGVPQAQTQCRALMHLLHERARFALRLPPAGRPLMHAQALRLQCGGLHALRQVMGPAPAEAAPKAWAAPPAAGNMLPQRPGADDGDVLRLVGLAQQRPGSLAELPWPELVAALVRWQPRQRSGARR